MWICGAVMVSWVEWLGDGEVQDMVGWVAWLGDGEVQDWLLDW